MKTVLGANIKTLRKSLKITTRKLAEKANVRYQTINKIENGYIESPRGSTIYNIAKILKTTPDFLMYGKGFSKVSVIPENKIPVLNWKEVNEWCQEGSNKSISSEHHEFIPSPIEEFNKSFFAIKMDNDVLDGENTTINAPYGSILFCEPIRDIIHGSLILFHNKRINISFIRETVIDETTYLRPSNINKYPLIEYKPSIHEPIAKVLCVLRFVNTQ